MFDVRRDQELSKDDVIATRQYYSEGTDPAQLVTVKISKPRVRELDGCYDCGVEISENGRVWVRYLIGADALEALQLALILVSTDLDHLNQQLDGTLRWLDGKRRDLGLPVPPKFVLVEIMTASAD